MRAAVLVRSSVLVAALSILNGCGSPSSPTSSGSLTYALMITPSASCRTNFYGSWDPNAVYTLWMAGPGNESNATGAVYRQLLPRQPSTGSQPPDSGSVTLAIVQSNSSLVSGTISGSGFTHESGLELEFGRGPDPLPLTGSVELPGGRMLGTFVGLLDWSIFASAAGGDCTASDHQWRLELLQ